MGAAAEGRSAGAFGRRRNAQLCAPADVRASIRFAIDRAGF